MQISGARRILSRFSHLIVSKGTVCHAERAGGGEERIGNGTGGRREGGRKWGARDEMWGRTGGLQSANFTLSARRVKSLHLLHRLGCSLIAGMPNIIMIVIAAAV